MTHELIINESQLSCGYNSADDITDIDWRIAISVGVAVVFSGGQVDELV